MMKYLFILLLTLGVNVCWGQDVTFKPHPWQIIHYRGGIYGEYGNPQDTEKEIAGTYGQAIAWMLCISARSAWLENNNAMSKVLFQIKVDNSIISATYKSDTLDITPGSPYHYVKVGRKVYKIAGDKKDILWEADWIGDDDYGHDSLVGRYSSDTPVIFSRTPILIGDSTFWDTLPKSESTQKYDYGEILIIAPYDSKKWIHKSSQHSFIENIPMTPNYLKSDWPSVVLLSLWWVLGYQLINL